MCNYTEAALLKQSFLTSHNTQRANLVVPSCRDQKALVVARMLKCQYCQEKGNPQKIATSPCVFLKSCLDYLIRFSYVFTWNMYIYAGVIYMHTNVCGVGFVVYLKIHRAACAEYLITIILILKVTI